MQPMRLYFPPRAIEVIETTQITEPPPIGQISAISGQAAFDAIVAAIAAAKCGEVSGIVTAPINKEAMASAESLPRPYGDSGRLRRRQARGDDACERRHWHRARHDPYVAVTKPSNKVISTLRYAPSAWPTRAGRLLASRPRGSL